MNNTTGDSRTAAWIFARASCERNRRNAGFLRLLESAFRAGKDYVNRLSVIVYLNGREYLRKLEGTHAT